MKRIKGLTKIVTLFIIVTLMITTMGIKSFAAKDNNDYYVMLYSKSSEKRPTGFYWVRTTTGTDKPVIKLVKTNAGGTTNSDQTVIYCLDNEKGFGTGSGGAAVDYKVYYDMRNPSAIDNNYKLAIPFSSSNYNSLMWLLDNIAVDEESKNALSTKLNTAKGFEISQLQDYTMPISNKTEQEKDILEVVQQSAIWRLLKSDGQFRPANPTDFAWTQNRNDGTPNNILDINYYNDMVEGGPAKALYEYLVSTALSNSSYDYTQNGTSPITYVKGFNNEQQASAVIDGENYKVGPYNLTNREGSNLVDIEVSIPEGATLVNASGTELTGSTNKEKIMNSFGQDFYVKVPVASAGNSITITVTPKYSTRQLQYRTTESSPSSNQPIVIIENKNLQETKTSTVPLTPPTVDLALRKYITGVTDSTGNSKTIDNISERTPTVDASTLEPTGATNTTAVYKHRKDPVKVESGDIVKYTIRVYNEGSVKGLATEIIDQLPVGLTYKAIETSNYTASIPDGAGNKVVFTRNNKDNPLNEFTKGGTLDYEDISITCEVTAEATSTNQVFTNIAWISKEYNAVTSEEFTTEGKDRDSAPSVAPAYSNDWKGTTTETDLSQHIFYPGQQDDDDFEKLILKTQVPQFDLALRKFISAVDGSPVATRVSEVEESEKQKLATDTALLDNGTTAKKTSIKSPYEVNANSIVTFTIRVYNEGQVDGHATEITDYIPEGLEFVTGTENNSQWSYDQSTKKATTTQLASTNIKALDTTTNTLDYKDIKIDCRVNGNGNNFKNIAAITRADGQDRDSQPGDVNPSNYNPTNPTEGRGEQDDDDYDEVKLPTLYFDLALRKYITGVTDSTGNRKTIDDISERVPEVNVSSLKNGTSPLDNGATALKEHTKDPLSVSKGDKVIYTIRIYNEGTVNGTATRIVDYLPEGLKLADNSQINNKYGWVPDNSGKAVATTYLAQKENIPAFDGNNISSDYVEIECEVIGNGFTSKNLKNVAEILESRNDANITTDRDSTPNNVQEKGDNYNVSTSTRGEGYEDDDDYENLLISRFDLALRKYITGVNDEVITNREPTVDGSKMGTIGADGKEITTFTYNHTKEPVKVEQNDVVIYTLRVYNEGNIDGYAEIIKDDIPEGLEYLPDHEINRGFGWTLQDENGNATTDVTKAKYVVTDYRSKAKSEDNIIHACTLTNNESTGITYRLDHQDVQVAFKVTQPATDDRIVINKAQISKHADQDGDSDIKDIDSTPDVWNEGEDDQDIEKIYVKYFDLALRKWVTHAIVIEDGVQKEMDTGHTADDDPESVVKIEINKKRLEDTVVKFRYNIKIINEGEIAGTATEISDYIPKGLKFNQADNPKWREENGKVVTDQLKDTMLQPGEEATVDILLTWENSESNMGVMVNVAEISEDYNESGTPDIDSIPDNRKEEEDDIDSAPVAITVVAGSAPTYIAIASAITLVVGGGVFFIKKYVI